VGGAGRARLGGCMSLAGRVGERTTSFRPRKPPCRSRWRGLRGDDDVRASRAVGGGMGWVGIERSSGVTRDGGPRGKQVAPLDWADNRSRYRTLRRPREDIQRGNRRRGRSVPDLLLAEIETNDAISHREMDKTGGAAIPWDTAAAAAISRGKANRRRGPSTRRSPG